MSNPIRIAPGPPTKECKCLCQPRYDKRWHICFVENTNGSLIVYLVNGLRMKVASCVDWRWTYPIPDPEE